MTTKEALIAFYHYNQLNLTDDFESHCVRVYIGCILAPVPNIRARKKYLKFHDLHHIMTEYGIDRVGESEISAWELGSRSCRKPLISVMNLFALSTGFVLKPKRVIAAFYGGCRSKNLYYMSDGMSESDIDRIDLEAMKAEHLERAPKIRYKLFRQTEFAGYLFFSMLIHVGMLFLGKSLLIAESVRNRLRPKIAP
ncbi:hypothetical protein [Flavobacterium sp.]|uniref:hypothetical protein n=1 Tax=Flavobacterium sp. TaxID=239 RepID=UPI0012106E81|nr:hypothetical protein [Flavobacterium sp.]RZJ72860.1 MAG: hypothetical protein EOO49_04295 [Flavobacterium sp.]